MSRMRNGRRVENVNRHMGGLRGTIVVGHNSLTDKPIERALFWYPNGRLTPARETSWDLIGGVE